MEFCFEIMPADRPDLKDQLARSLDLQTELRSRQKLPRLWKKTDQLNSKVSDDVVKRRKTKNKVFGIFFMIVGIVLLLTGLDGRGGLNGPLVGGVVGLFVGITYLSPKSNNPPKKCQQMAQKLLDMRRTIPYARARFTEEGLTINTANTIPYNQIEGMLETEDLYLMIINNSAMFFIKTELMEGSCAAFSDFMQQIPGFAFQQIG